MLQVESYRRGVVNNGVMCPSLMAMNYNLIVQTLSALHTFLSPELISHIKHKTFCYFNDPVPFLKFYLVLFYINKHTGDISDFRQ